jgi:hypothetical protein
MHLIQGLALAATRKDRMLQGRRLFRRDAQSAVGSESMGCRHVLPFLGTGFVCAS